MELRWASKSIDSEANTNNETNSIGQDTLAGRISK